MRAQASFPNTRARFRVPARLLRSQVVAPLDSCVRRADYVRSVIELVAGTTDTSAAARIRTAVWRWIVSSPESIEHFRGTMPMFRDWLAPGREEDVAALAVNCVLPDARCKGVGTAIHRQVPAHARSLGKSELQAFVIADDPGGSDFAEHRGFVVTSRTRGLRLVLDGCPRPTIELPDEIEITTLAERPALAQGVWETAIEAMAEAKRGRTSRQRQLPVQRSQIRSSIAAPFARPVDPRRRKVVPSMSSGDSFQRSRRRCHFRQVDSVPARV
jgi:GNAT superfamily N-acetyltransferase